MVLAEDYHTDEKMHELMDELTKRAYKQLEVVMSFFVLGGDSEHDVLATDLLTKALKQAARVKRLVAENVIFANCNKLQEDL